ncbi:hypothetical protein NDU88_003168 [Pleurodeles waltl]|uniref:Uncharacterized protein n=1 Tax=Pleurodeles waltl TaxID=8319 RepID=A0AAV7VFV0_PLEWA|nr:hypothetical protein NDU88_003168 [Pleurodeles waltl]
MDRPTSFPNPERLCSTGPCRPVGGNFLGLTAQINLIRTTEPQPQGKERARSCCLVQLRDSASASRQHRPLPGPDGSLSPSPLRVLSSWAVCFKQADSSGPSQPAVGRGTHSAALPASLASEALPVREIPFETNVEWGAWSHV